MRDIRHALRVFRKAPIWTLGVAATLALGIGAATAMFSIGNAVLFRSLPYPEPDRLVVLSGSNPRKGIEDARVTLPDFADWRARASVFDEIGYSFLWPGSRSTIVRTSTSEEVRSAQVSSAWLRALGLNPVLGRIFTRDEDRRGANLVAMISDGFWERQFARDPSVIGRTLTIDNYNLKNYQIIGIMPPGLQFPPGTDVWLSLGAAQFEPPPPGAAGQRCCEWLQVIARLRRGVGIKQARTELNAIQSSILAAHGPADVNPAVTITPLARYLTGDSRQAILILMAAVGCVLLIACVNAANLLLARSGSRRHEMAIRIALGATRLRVIRQLLTESVMISMVAGVAGLALGSAALQVFQAMAPNIPRLNEAGPDSSFVSICAALAMLTGIAFGLAPALQWSGSSFVHGQTGLGGEVGMRGARLRDALVIGEVAVSTVLLIGAALLLRSLDRLVSVDPGFRPAGVLTAHVDMSSTAYSTSAMPGPHRPQVYFQRVVEQLRTLPGVIAVGGVNRLPMAGILEGEGEAVVTEDGANASSIGASSLGIWALRGDGRAVTPDYFRAIGMRLLRGRGFTEADTDASEAVVIVDESAARRYWPGQDPLGRRMATINTRFPAPPHWMKVVGVVADVRFAGMQTAARPQFYLPYLRGEWRSPFLVLRVQGQPAALIPAVRRQVSAVDHDAVTTDVRPMEELVLASTSQARFRTRLLTAFSGLALLLAVAGIYGVVSCIVEQRTAEIGVRMALGARAIDIFVMVLGRGAALAAVGLAAGMGAALMLRPLIAALLFETRASDPAMLSTAVAVLLLAGLGACWAPARRAARLDPFIAIRHEDG